jgi:opacity protein-like surface antigen
MSMRLKQLSILVAFLVPSAAAFAHAADLDYQGGSVKDYRAVGVPVPAPIPVPETFKWYLRADIGGGWISEPDISESGYQYGLDRYPADGPAFGMSSSWFNTGFDTFAMAGVGAGVYLTPRFRADLTVDARTSSSVVIDGNYSYRRDPPPCSCSPTERVDGHTWDKTEVHTTVGLANLYWDLVERGNRFVPYVGVGAGFAVVSMDRKNSTSETVYDIATGDPTGETNSYSGNGKTHQVAPAFAAMIGVGYTLSPGMVIDLNYRYTYIGEVEFKTDISGQQSKLSIGDTSEHTLRAGLRWNIW